MSFVYYDAGPLAGGQKVMLATTVYDKPDASYTFSIANSLMALHEAGIETAYMLLEGNCHVDDARNSVVHDFLQSDCTDLIFLDADVSWQPQHLVELCRFDCDMVGGVYPYRREGEGDNMPVRMLPDHMEPDANGLLEVDGLPTGFLRIRRAVFDKMRPYVAAFDKGGKLLPVYFERDVLGVGRRGGDIGFSMRWRAMGGRIFAAANLRLGHVAKMVLTDSLSASLRRQTGTTLRHVCAKVKAGAETDDDLYEAYKFLENRFGAPVEQLKSMIGMARNSKLPILEMGTGLSTILMAAATDQKVWAVEHHPFYADALRAMVRAAGVDNVALVTAPIKDRWYDLAEDLATMPEQFGLAVVDGPPRTDGDRMRFFEPFGERCDVILIDDANSDKYLGELNAWAAAHGRLIHADCRAAVIYKAG